MAINSISKWDNTPDFLNNKTQYTLLEIQTILNNVSNGWIDENED